MSELIVKDNALLKAELDTQITTAKAYPRTIKNFIPEAISMATLDQETAEACIYSVPRKNKDGKDTFIKGESIRLAEICAIAWGNIHAGSRLVSNDGRTVTVEGVAWDLEKNLRVSKEVKKSIYSEKYKRVYSEDMQIVTGNAASSIALRNAYLSVIPRALVKRVYEAAVQFAIGDQTQLSKKIDALFSRFQKLGINKEKILAYFSKKVPSEITVDEVEEMIGIGTAIKDNQLNIDKAFVSDQEAAPTAELDDLNERLNKNIPAEQKDKKSSTDPWLDQYDGKS